MSRIDKVNELIELRSAEHSKERQRLDTLFDQNSFVEIRKRETEQVQVFLRNHCIKQRDIILIQRLPYNTIHLHLLPDLDAHILPVQQVNHRIAADDPFIHAGRDVNIKLKLSVYFFERKSMVFDRDLLLRTALSGNWLGGEADKKDEKSKKVIKTHTPILKHFSDDTIEKHTKNYRNCSLPGQGLYPAAQN